MNKVEIGSTIHVRFNDGEQEAYQLVPSDEADLMCNRVSADSAFGRAIIGKRAGECIKYCVKPSCAVECTIIKLN